MVVCTTVEFRNSVQFVWYLPLLETKCLNSNVFLFGIFVCRFVPYHKLRFGLYASPHLIQNIVWGRVCLVINSR